MIKPDSTQTEKHTVRKTMKALGIIMLFGLFIMMIASVMYIYRESCMTMFGTAIGLTVLLLAKIASFILLKKMMHNKGKRKWYTVLTTIIFLFFCAVTTKHILFPPIKEIPVTGSYQIGTEDYWVNMDIKDPYLSDGSLRELQIRKWFPVDASGYILDFRYLQTITIYDDFVALCNELESFEDVSKTLHIENGE